LSTGKKKYMEVFVQRLLGARHRKGLTQTELARKLRVHLRSVQNWEGGLTEPRGKVLRDLSGILDISVPFMLGMDEKKGSSKKFYSDEGGEVRQLAHEHLDRVMNKARGDRHTESWYLTELKRRFPLSSSGVDAVAEDILSGAAGSGRHRGRASSRSRGAGGPSARTSGRARGAGMRPSKRP
jgi:transcriptional regulator with XRE-family HTH domain